MRVLMATPSLAQEVGGPAYSVLRTHEELALASVESQLLTKWGGGGSTSISEWARHTPTGADILHNFGAWTPFNHQVSRWAQRAGTPEILCPMGMLEPWSLAQRRVKKRLAWLLYQRRNAAGAAVLHATAKTEGDHLRALGLKNPIAVIPRGIDFPMSDSLSRGSSRNRKQRVLLFLSRIHPKKGLLELVEACSSVRETKGWRLVIAGPDAEGYQAVVAAAVKRAGLEDKVNFVGPVWGDAKRRLFAEADVFVLPTHSENFGVVIGEALAHGVPVITTTGAPWAELCEFRCGWWIPQGASALKAALEEALSVHNSVLADMGSRGQSLVRERYGWPAVVRQHIELYSWVAGWGPKPACVGS
jgi:glycosyltransferase involved in cell wall biosynthesis